MNTFGILEIRCQIIISINILNSTTIYFSLKRMISKIIMYLCSLNKAERSDSLFIIKEFWHINCRMRDIYNLGADWI